MLADGANSYLYGVGRIGEEQPGGWQYHLGDALGSVRQMADQAGELTMMGSYLPYGVEAIRTGAGATGYGFTGEWTDPTGLIYLQTRYYDARSGRFLSKDSWQGDYAIPISYNSWIYGYDNPIVHTDPSGKCPDENMDGRCDPSCAAIPDPNPVPDPNLIDFAGTWSSQSEKTAIENAALDVGKAMAYSLNSVYFTRVLFGTLTPSRAFLLGYGGSVKFQRHTKTCSKYFVDWRDNKIEEIGSEAFHNLYNDDYDDAEEWTCWGYTLSSNWIYAFSNKPTDAYDTSHWAVHELGHAFNSEVDNQAASMVGSDPQWDDILSNRDRGFLVNEGRTRPWQQSATSTESEIFADMFLGWVYGAWAQNEFGTYRANFMTTRMFGLLLNAASANR